MAPGADALAGLARFDERLPVGPTDPAETLALLDTAGSPATVASNGPRYFGFVIGGAWPVAVASGWLASAWDQNAALPVMSPAAARIGEVARKWIVELLGFPPASGVAFVSGATMANAAALAVARDRQLARVGWDVQARGLFGAPDVTVVVGEHVHSTLFKALGMIGLGRERVMKVPADGQGRMVASQLPAHVDGPVIVCAQAGEVNTGAFDPLEDVVAWSRPRGAWVHIDGAFGLWALADPSRAALVRGVRDADSWATDAHKWLNVSYDSGVVVVREAEGLRASFASVAGYLPPDDGYEAMHHAPDTSQRARQIEVWAVLRSLGREGVARLVSDTCKHAAHIADALSAAGLDVLNDVVLNQVLVRAHDDPLTSAWIDAVQADGTCWCGPTRWQGRLAMRVSVSGWATTAADASASAEAMVHCARDVGAIS